jgi:hypothetical protein
VAGDGLSGVAGRVELEVLRVVAWLLVLGVELGHPGRRICGFVVWMWIWEGYASMRIEGKVSLACGLCIELFLNFR